MLSLFISKALILTLSITDKDLAIDPPIKPKPMITIFIKVFL